MEVLHLIKYYLIILMKKQRKKKQKDRNAFSRRHGPKSAWYELVMTKGESLIVEPLSALHTTPMHVAFFFWCRGLSPTGRTRKKLYHG